MHRNVISLIMVITVNKVYPEPRDPMGGADLRFNSPQPHTSFHHKTTDMRLVFTVCSMVLSPVPNHTT